MDSRQQFEEYILKRHASDIDYWKDKGGLTGMIGSDLYNVVWVQNDYELWQASRESLVVELPEITESNIDFALNCHMEDPSDDEEAGFYSGVSWCRAFLKIEMEKRNRK